MSATASAAAATRCYRVKLINVEFNRFNALFFSPLIRCAYKIPADIFTFEDNKNKLFYRVRIGPYTTKSEAEYWRTRIIQIDEFSKAESFVTSTTSN